MSKYVVSAEWSDVPHLTDEERKELLASIPEYQRDARSRGIPSLGSGLVYPFSEDRIKIDPIALPRHWARSFGLDSDAGRGFTAMIFSAWDRDTDTVYVYKDYKSESREKSVHVDAIRSQGIWIPGVGDAAALLVTAHDSQQVIELYRAAGVDIDLPDKAVEAGIQAVYDRFSTGRLKIFSTCTELLSELRRYHRKDGRIVKQNDHACLVGDTEIVVLGGNKRLMDVTTNDSVLTRRGWRRVMVSEKTAINVNVMTVSLSNGLSITGTASHPFILANGDMARMDSLRYGDILYGCEKQEQSFALSLWSTRVSSSGDTQTPSACLTGLTTDPVGNTLLTALSHCTEKSGKTPTAQSHSGCTSTTAMVIPRTTQSRTLSASRLKSTEEDTSAGRITRPTLNESDLSRKSGTPAQSEESGTGSTAKTSGAIKSLSRGRATSVGTCIRLEREAGQDFAGTIAGLAAEDCLGSTPSRVSANGARQNSAPTSIQSIELVHAPVAVLGVRIETRKADVYNLTVDGEHEYVANGVLTHNCDSLRYDVYSGLVRAKVEPEKQESSDALSYGEQGYRSDSWLAG